MTISTICQTSSACKHVILIGRRLSNGANRAAVTPLSKGANVCFFTRKFVIFNDQLCLELVCVKIDLHFKYYITINRLWVYLAPPSPQDECFFDHSRILVQCSWKAIVAPLVCKIKRHLQNLFCCAVVTFVSVLSCPMVFTYHLHAPPACKNHNAHWACLIRLICNLGYAEVQFCRECL